MKMFDRDYIEKELKELDETLGRKVEIFVLGGAAMSFQNLKDATKDIDVVLKSPSEFKVLVKALKNCKYDEIAVKAPYDIMDVSAILENAESFRWDIFVRRVCRGLTLSKAMVERSKPMLTLKKVVVRMVSPEDIFIFKSVTSRMRDREDMHTLFRQGLDFDAIRSEIKWQSEASKDKAWLAFFFTGLEELRDRHHLVIPRYREFYTLACDEVLKHILKDYLRTPRSLEQICRKTRENERKVRKALNELVALGLIEKKGKGRSAKYALV